MGKLASSLLLPDARISIGDLPRLLKLLPHHDFSVL
jgi:hypothetical protein